MAERELNPFSNAGIEFCDVRSGGEYFSRRRDESRTVSFPHPRGECGICMDESGLRMECGHFICPDDILELTWSQLGRLKYEISCAMCAKPIKQDNIIKFGLPTLEEKQFIFTAIATNFCESQDIQRCPKCQTLCQRINAGSLQVDCVTCQNKDRKSFKFCWCCLREWKNPSDCQVCGNANCKKEMIEQLITSPKKEFQDCNGKKVNIPTIRACPECYSIQEFKYSGGCSLFKCSSCREEFCYICLSKKSGSLICRSMTSPGIMCSPAPIQTKLR